MVRWLRKHPSCPNAQECPSVVRSDRGKYLGLVWREGHLNLLQFLDCHPALVLPVSQIEHVDALEKAYKLHIGFELIILAGTPTAVAPVGTSQRTTALAPIFAWSLILTALIILAPAPIST